MPHTTLDSFAEGLQRLKGTADHFLKIWLTLKQMGMTEQNPVYVTTSSPNQALKRLYDYNHPDGELYVPFAHTRRFLTMRADAGRSIVQTTLRRWQASGSVVTVDPSDYLHVRETEDGLTVSPGRIYPQGLGYGKNGFSLEDNGRVVIPLLAFGIWYYRQNELNEIELEREIVDRLSRDLNLSPAEMEVIFVKDDPPWVPQLQKEPLTNATVFDLVQAAIEGGATKKKIIGQTFEEYTVKVKSMVTIAKGPNWLVSDPENRLQALISEGAKAILLYGPPRTGKTRAVDQLFSRSDSNRETIQVHEGWGYDELIMGLRPSEGGSWSYRDGPLLTAIRNSKKTVVLEEINRTEFTQAIGETFSLIEEVYRGEENQIRLRDNSMFYIPKETLILCTMNTLDRSTEEIDDALFGRMAAVEFPPTSRESARDLAIEADR